MNELIKNLTESIVSEMNDSATALTALETAETAEPLPETNEIRDHLPEKGVAIGLHRLLARRLERDGEIEESRRVLLQIAERLNQAEFWTALVRVVLPLLEVFPQQVGPLLVRIRGRGGQDLVPDEAVFTAHRLLPHHGLLAWESARAHLARGDRDAARDAAGRALPELLEDKNYEMADEAVLLLAEISHPRSVPVFLRSLELLARQESWERFDTLLDLTLEQLASPETAALTWPVLSQAWLRHPDLEAMRPRMVQVARGELAGYPEPESLIRISKLAIPSEDPQYGLDRLRRAREFPPGYYAAHASWGIGKIRENDTEALVIDFPAKPLHRMTVETAERALDVLEPGDLAVLETTRPEELARLVREEPATIVYLALRRLDKDEVTVDLLRKCLVPGVVPASGWAGWWKGAKKNAASDARIDSRRAYDNIYRLPAPDEVHDEVPLPEWNPRVDVLKNLAVLDTFSSHHPEAQQRLTEGFSERLKAVAGDGGFPSEERTAAALWLVRHAETSPMSAAELVWGGFDFNRLSKTYQEQLLEMLDSAAGWMAALGSRLIGIRRGAWESLGKTGERDSAAATLLENAPGAPESALHVLEAGLEEATYPASAVLTALVDLLEIPPRETHRKRALALLVPDGPLARHLERGPIDEAGAGRLITRLKQWRASDKFRFPLLDFLKEARHSEIADAVEGYRARSAARLGARVEGPDEDPYAGDLVLTRISFDRYEEERTRLGMELKTNIPRAIQSARDLGDLKENAEYHAVKAKQAEYAQRFQDLGTLLKRVRLIESLDRPPAVALPGTEIELESTEGAEGLALWMLGEGDQDLGPEVVSYKAPLGKALFGRREGDEVVLPSTGRTYRIARVTERLP